MILFIILCNESKEKCYLNQHIIKTNKAEVEIGFQYTIEVIRQSKIHNSSFWQYIEAENKVGMSAIYRASLQGPILAMVDKQEFFIMPVEPHTSINAV